VVLELKWVVGMSWGTTWAGPNVYEMLSIVRFVLACGLPTQKAGHARGDEQVADSTETLSGIHGLGGHFTYIETTGIQFVT
jgi:hypothetical protein